MAQLCGFQIAEMSSVSAEKSSVSADGAAMGGMMVTKGLGRCGWSYDSVEGSVVVART